MELKLGYDKPEAVRELFTEYTQMLVAHDPYFQAISTCSITMPRLPT